MAINAPSEATRAYFYRIVLALQPVIVAYGVVSSELAALWISVISAVLVTGLATANTSTSKDPAPADPVDFDRIP